MKKDTYHAAAGDELLIIPKVPYFKFEDYKEKGRRRCYIALKHLRFVI